MLSITFLLICYSSSVHPPKTHRLEPKTHQDGMKGSPWAVIKSLCWVLPLFLLPCEGTEDEDVQPVRDTLARPTRDR